MPRRGAALIDSPDFRLGKPSRVKLRQDNIVSAYLLVLTGVFAVTGGSGAGTVYSDALHRLLESITLRANGTDFQRYTGQFLRILHQIYGSAGYKQTPPADLDAGGNDAFEANFLLPLFMPWSKHPDDFALPSALVGAPQLTVQLAQAEDMVTGTDATALAIQNGELALYEYPLYGSEVPAHLHQGMQIVVTEVDVPQSGRMKIRMEELLRGMKLRAVFVTAESGGSGGADYTFDDAVVTDIRLVIDGEDEFESVPFDVIQNRNKDVYGLESLETGTAVLDAAEDRELRRDSDWWTIRTGSRPYVEADVEKQAGENRIRVYTIFTDPHIGRR